jgi:hypothetical protein
LSKANRRFIRTVILGVLAMSSLIWVATDQFELSVEEMLNLFYVTAIAVGAVIGFAAIGVTLLNVLRKLRKQKRN